MRVVVRGQQILELEGAKVEKNTIFIIIAAPGLLALLSAGQISKSQDLRGGRQAKQSKAKASKRWWWCCVDHIRQNG